MSTSSTWQQETRALLLTDIVDSTALVHRLGSLAAAGLWHAHDRAARDLIRNWRGREIDKSDGMLVLFDTADDGVGFARAYHQALAGLNPPLKARAGLHVGAVVMHENSAADVALGAKPVEVDGVAKPTAARVAALARAGQTLVTVDAARALQGETSLRSLGHWCLKGVDEPIELFELEQIGSVQEPLADGDKGYRVVHDGDMWLPVRQIRHSIPVEQDAFIGRAQPLLDLARLIDEGARLVSILGTGGSGKTRLATRFGWSSLGDFPGGVWFCDLSQARDENGIVRAVADVLDVPLGSEDAVRRLGHAIAGRGRCLLILDNFEQVALHAPMTLGAWLHVSVDACFVATSREVLGLPGERQLVLLSLPTADAVELFLCRAQSTKPDFRPTPEDNATLERLVTLLDGLPLAIELAAARVRVMPPRTVLARMHERFKLLARVGARRDRQATLRAAIDWSWELLSLAERAALAQLSVFEGGFTLDAAEAVLDLEAHDEAPWPPDAVQSLVDKSLVRAGAGDRFELLVSIKAYAAEQLGAPSRFCGSGPEALRAAQARHVAYYAALGEQHCVARGYADLDNLVAACQRAVAHPLPECVAGALEGAWGALSRRGPVGDAVALASLAVTAPLPDAESRARVQRVAGDTMRLAGRVVEAHVLLEDALAAARDGKDRALEAQVLSSLGHLDEGEGRLDDARVHYEEACDLALAIGHSSLEAEARNQLAAVHEAQGRMEVARHHFERALATAQLASARWLEGRVLSNLAVLHVEQGRIDEGRLAYERGLATAREVGDRRWESNLLCNLGLVYQLEGRLADARACLLEALALGRELGNPRLVSIVLCNLGLVLGDLGSLEEAQERFESALVIARESRDQRSEGQFLSYLAVLHARRGRFDVARDALHSAEDLLRAASDRFSLGILLCQRAETELLAGDPARAADALAEARGTAEAVGAGPKSELGIAIARVACMHPD